MDERIEKAFGIVNYVATLSTQRKIALEELNQKLVYYSNGGTFKVTMELINFTKTLIDLGHSEDVGFLDSNNLPVIIPDLKEFQNRIVEIYFESINGYAKKFNDIKTKRKVEDIVKL